MKTIRDLHKPPHIEGRVEAIIVRGAPREVARSVAETVALAGIGLADRDRQVGRCGSVCQRSFGGRLGAVVDRLRHRHRSFAHPGGPSRHVRGCAIQRCRGERRGQPVHVRQGHHVGRIALPILPEAPVRTSFMR
jgi:hypothetical protein